MGKKRSQNCEEKPLSHKVPGVASGQQKQETSRRLRSRQKLVVQLRNNEETKKEDSRQALLADEVVKIPVNFSLFPPGHFCKETFDLSQKMIALAGEDLPAPELILLSGKLMDKFGPSYRSFVIHLLKNIFLKVLFRCLQEDAGLSDEGMAEMCPLHLLRLFDGVNNTHAPSGERKMKVLVTEFGLDPVQDIFTELVEKMFKAFAEVAPNDFAKLAHRDAMAHAMALAVRGLSLASQ